jgi:hypothetical protein
MEGRFGGLKAGTGLFKASRAGAPKVTGVWTGEWEIDPDGSRGAGHYMVLQQDGAAVTGTVGPNSGQQAPIANGKLTGDQLSFDLSIPFGPKLAFAFTVSGDTMSGTAVLTMKGVDRSFKLSAKRALQ